MHSTSTKSTQVILKTMNIDTTLGPMIAIADDKGLYLLEFTDCKGFDREIALLKQKLNATLIQGESDILNQINTEIKNYFDGKITQFNTPLHLTGTTFQNKVWNELIKIPTGETKSYLEIAKSIKQPSACRAVARANGSNQLAIIIPCHRVINTNGKLGGYSSGIARKQWLLDHEKTF